jgi:hypothetical protein
VLTFVQNNPRSFRCRFLLIDHIDNYKFIRQHYISPNLSAMHNSTVHLSVSPNKFISSQTLMKHPVGNVPDDFPKLQRLDFCEWSFEESFRCINDFPLFK